MAAVVVDDLHRDILTGMAFVTRVRSAVVVRRWPWAVAAAALAYAVLASFTHPFTDLADVVTAVPLGVALVVVVRTIRVGRRSLAPPVGPDSPLPSRSGWALWGSVAAVVAGWELYCLSNLPRSRYPTLSSLIDLFDSTRAGKTVAFAAWLALGWYLAGR
jgi:hypothetical protein